jgi:hypothetical protein
MPIGGTTFASKCLRLILSGCFSLSVASGCGPSSNILGLITPNEHRDSFEYRLAAGQAAYDRGDLKEALKQSLKAYDMAPESEDAALLFGYVNLSIAGADPISIAKALTKSDDDEGTSGVFGPLKASLGLNDAEFALLGDPDNSIADLPIYVPKCVEGLRNTIDRLARLDDAIQAVCPFVSASARVTDDYRQRCDDATEVSAKPHKAHFLWAFAHLAEAMAFHSVLTYATADPDKKKSNLELRVERVASSTTTDASSTAAFIASVQSLETTLQAVMPAGGACSEAEPTPQIFATLNDLLAVDAAFALIPGMPKGVKKSIAKTMGKIKEVGASGGKAGELKAMKGDLTKKMSEALSAKIDALGADPATPIPAGDKDELCDAYAGIAAGNPAPAVCGG